MAFSVFTRAANAFDVAGAIIPDRADARYSRMSFINDNHRGPACSREPRPIMSVKIIVLRDPNRIQAAEIRSLCPCVKWLESRRVVP
jgi:hypothetical protein